MRATIYRIRPTFAKELSIQQVQDRLAKSFEVKENGCWEWTTGKFNTGYGKLSLWGRTKRGGQFMVHRIMYELIFGAIGKDRQIDHLCRERACVNPQHMEVVTKDENNIRGNSPSAIHARKTHCPQGHPYSGNNLQIENKPNGKTMRRCRTCRNKQQRDKYLRMKARKNNG